MRKVAQINPVRNALKSAYDLKSLVDVRTNDKSGEDEFTGFVVKVSNQFAMLHVVEDWHSDGIRIVPMKFISTVDLSSNSAERKAILIWNNLESADEYLSIEIDDFQKIFRALKSKHKVISIEDSESVEIGLITEVADQTVTLKGIDGAGKWLEDEVVRPYHDIWHIAFNDEYSRVLGSYLDSKKLRNRAMKGTV